jgi:site-specific recombinase XerD
MARGISHVIHYAGKPIDRIGQAWEAVRKAAGAERKDAPHIMRHTSATLFMNAGVDVALVSGWLGMSSETLLDVYGHHHPAFQQTIAQVSPRKQTNPK